MVTGLPAWVSAAFSVMALLAGAAAAVAYYRASDARTRLTDLRGDVADRDTRIKFLEDREERRSKEEAAKDAEISKLRVKVSALERAAAGAEHWGAITELLAAHHRDVLTSHEQQNALMHDVLAMLGAPREKGQPDA